MATPPVLYSALACNFCHRNRVTLHHKGVEAELARPGHVSQSHAAGRAELTSDAGRLDHGELS